MPSIGTVHLDIRSIPRPSYDSDVSESSGDEQTRPGRPRPPVLRTGVDPPWHGRAYGRMAARIEAAVPDPTALAHVKECNPYRPSEARGMRPARSAAARGHAGKGPAGAAARRVTVCHSFVCYSFGIIWNHLESLCLVCCSFVCYSFGTAGSR